MAANALSFYGTSSLPALPLLVAGMSDPTLDSETRWQFIRALSGIGPSASNSVQLVFDAFARTNEPNSVRRDARIAIEAIDKAEILREKAFEMWRDRNQGDGWRREAWELYKRKQPYTRNDIAHLSDVLRDVNETSGVRDTAAEMLQRATSNVLQRCNQREVSAFYAAAVFREVRDAFQDAKRVVPSDIDRAYLVANAERRQNILAGWVVILLVALLSVGLFYWSGRRAFNRAAESVCVIESEHGQGSGFFLRGVGFVTCAHVLKGDDLIFHPRDQHKRGTVEVRMQDVDADVSILNTPLRPQGELLSATGKLKTHQRVAIVGFPNFDRLSPRTILPARIVGIRLQAFVMLAQ